MAEFKPDVKILNKGKLGYIAQSDGGYKKFKPWLGDSFAFLYDFIMNRSVFPKKFGGDVRKHYQILSREMADIRGRRILELGTGSGSAIHFLDSGNHYTGTDVSPGLLKQAVKRFEKAGFPSPEFYVVSADDLPFENGVFDVCLCILSLNFIGNVEKVFLEVDRVLRPSGVFVCSVPVPEKNRLNSTIRGVLYSEAGLERMCRDHGFKYERIPGENGALLYFKASKQMKKDEEA
jgi:ubiquinone/menaquinone biosynthesis C-methylase UbiE